MKTELAHEIIECLPKDRTLFRYYKDYYAVYLVHRELQQRGDMAVSDLRQGRLGKLLTKPIFAELLATSGSGKLTATDIEQFWPSHLDYGYLEPYVLTLGLWGNSQARHYRHYQVSRPGKNLVLQMNFCNRHNQHYKRCINDDMDYFKFSGHPVSRQYCTLAWARIDMDITTGEALIEEIQNDWLRDMAHLKDHIQWYANKGYATARYGDLTLNIADALTYLDDEIKRHQAIWSEAMLSATLKFLYDEIGITQIYYHTPDTGAVLKNIKYSKPPRSIYTKLPKQFCFEQVNEAPTFIANDKQAKRRLKAIKNQQCFYRAA